MQISLESDVYGPLIPLPFYQEKTQQSWIIFPIQYGELPLDSYFKIICGSTTLVFRLFDLNSKQLKCGMHLSSVKDPHQQDIQQEPWKVLVKAFEEGQIPREPWLDQRTFGKLENLDSNNDDNVLKLFVDLPLFDLPVIFEETDLVYNQAPPPPKPLLDNLGFTNIQDDDFIHDNLVEAMHRKLFRSNAGPRYGNLYDRDLKPNSKIRDEINVREGFKK